MTTEEITTLKQHLPTLEGSGFILRPFRAGDEQELASLIKNINSSKIAARVSNVPYPYTREHAEAWVKRVTGGQEPRADFVIEIDGEVAGSVALINIEGHKAQMSYWLGEVFQRRGIMTEAVKLVTDFARNSCEFARVWAYTFEGNIPSQRVLEKAGFVFEGIHRKEWLRDGVYHDSHMYAVVTD